MLFWIIRLGLLKALKTVSLTVANPSALSLGEIRQIFPTEYKIHTKIFKRLVKLF